MILCIENYQEFKMKFLNFSYLYDFKKTYREYVEIFEMTGAKNDKVV